MNNPVITWLDKDFAPLTGGKIQFNDGTVDNPVLADTDSAEVEFYISNNFTYGTPIAEDAFDIKNCSLTVKATDGTMNEQLVQEKWVSVRCLSMGELDYTNGAIGAHLDGATYVEDNHAIGCGDATVGVNNIAGIANDGTDTGTGKNNLAKMKAIAHPSFVGA